MRKRRLSLGLRQIDVARLIGVTVDCVSEWERGQGRPAAPLIPKVMDFLGYCPYERPTTFGDWLGMAREAVGLSQAALARALGIDKGNVSQWERGETRPWPRSIRRLREFFGEPDERLPQWLAEALSRYSGRQVEAVEVGTNAT